MSQRRVSVIATLVVTGSLGCAQAATLSPTDFGQPLSASDARRYLAVPPSGTGLPPGHGTAAEGAEVYANACVACHGVKLEGVAAAGGPPLIGGRGTLASGTPLKTVESYWPYATTLFDYVKRAMPFYAPGSLTDDQVYAVTAYVLAKGHVIDPGATMDATTLPAVRMPNKDGFIPDPRRH